MNLMEIHLGRTVVKIDMKTVKKKFNSIYKNLGSPPVVKMKKYIDDHGVEKEKESSVYWRPQLHEIPDSIKPMDDSYNIQCGIFCELASQEYSDFD